jgi:hypothetical protein
MHIPKRRISKTSSTQREEYEENQDSSILNTEVKDMDNFNEKEKEPPKEEIDHIEKENTTKMGWKKEKWIGRQKLEKKKSDEESEKIQPECTVIGRKENRKKFKELMEEKERLQKEEEEMEEMEENNLRSEMKEEPQWIKNQRMNKSWKEYTIRKLRRNVLKDKLEATPNSLLQWAWFFMKFNKEIPEKLMSECRILYGILNMQEIKEERLKELTSHAAKIIAIHKNGLERKGKYKRIIRTKEYQKILEILGTKKVEKVSGKSIKKRMDMENQEEREIKYFWEQRRKDNYYARRKSEPEIKIVKILEEEETIWEERKVEENSELVPEQNYNSNRKRFRANLGRKKKKKMMVDRPKEKEKIRKEIKKICLFIRTNNKGWRYKDALKRKRFKSKEQEKIIHIYQKRFKIIQERKSPIIENLEKKYNEEKKRIEQYEEVGA